MNDKKITIRPPISTSWQDKLISRKEVEYSNVMDEEIEEIYEKQEALRASSDEPWIQTFSGKRFNLLNPTADSIVIQDIAHALSMQCRFTGHTKFHYSVAQHSVYVSYFCNQEDALYGLLHDGSEAYIADINRPLKNTSELTGYKKVEKNLQKAIYNKFSLFGEEPASVKKADLLMLATEARDLMAPMHKDWKTNGINPIPFKVDRMTMDEAEDLFMKRFYELTGLGDDAYDLYYSRKYEKTIK